MKPAQVAQFPKREANYADDAGACRLTRASMLMMQRYEKLVLMMLALVAQFRKGGDIDADDARAKKRQCC